MEASRFIEIGLLTRPHGLKGEVCVDYYADSPFLLEGTVYLKAGRAAPRPVKVQSMRMHKGRPLVIFEGVNDRTAAELLRGHVMLVPEDTLPELDEDEVYLFELEGISVVIDESGEHLGVIERIDTDAYQEIWVIRTPQGKEVLFPAAAPFVLDIDLDSRTARIAPPPGLLDIYLSD
ncbi:ribosome maturation factor RimM [Nitratidesulfovibrio vulgaris]|jgi:16S rRNA processing protein RimM|uniref:Ribosome maturation factor RimM n=2 Tax=Nitratidesulfovibrio vulgaris TaxID=881 RepID=RIMM_NITV2|nr:ribosome maturation factor RimM [Nitratidesulfovibrio vulgaris]A1VFE4.1 RecName: Full=Ribosome maturation factor RimM [Nitratidesulfovibrio vulgaris DP4]Q72DU2.1 RecName: Full=Ribosome maturation factor RimM [Nitratidesulfovibrio vulgaris str. Hildenborough]GEB81331.1 ribosome maturation factor RimM [Desulfovibrio desulfuricans]HBW14790.1 16S rRNA processing protein RimM [Desulfovibrio sp.]AAS95317.1 16S rRNA processing protein RimM [Nitratidesulfovibrio vulgaris str. Hildenborough]ABM2916